MAFIRIVLFASFVGVAVAAEWDCSTTSGTFTRSTDCVVSSQIVVTGKLNITGVPDSQGNLPKIIGGGSNRLFKVESGGELVVKYLNLTGGVASGSAAAGNGGAIYMSDAFINITKSAFFNNQASTNCGGAIYATSVSGAWNVPNTDTASWMPDKTNAKILLQENYFEGNKNTGTHGGSAICIWSTPEYVEISDSNFTKNKEAIAVQFYYTRNVAIRNSKFIANTGPSTAALGLYASSALVENALFKENVGSSVIQLYQQMQSYVGFFSVLILKDSTMYGTHDELIESTHQSLIQAGQTPGNTLYIINSVLENGNNPVYTGDVSIKTCTDIAQCSNKGYDATSTCLDNSNKGIICVQNCSAGYRKSGTYNHTCQICPAETFSTRNNEITCTDWSNCIPGQKIAAIGTSSTDRICNSCGAGKFTNFTNAFSCTSWKNCLVGEYISTNGTITADRVCVECSTDTFTNSTNAFSCTSRKTCLVGEYISTNGTSSSDRVCSSCELGKYSVSTNAYFCTNFTDCIAGEYISTNGTSNSDRVCSSCSPGKYTASTNAFACTDWADCAAGEYISTNGTSSSDRVCSGCELGKYTGFSNSFACTDWKNCIAGEYISTNGTSSFDRVCSSCSPGKYTASTNAFACTDWADCAAGEYISTNGTSSFDRVCSGCELGKYSVSTNAYFCTNWTDCVAGQKIASNGTISANRKCTTCSSGQYSTTTNEFSCTNWTDCKLSEIEIVAGSTKRDRVCASSESPSPTAESPSPSGNTPSSSESTVNSQSPSESVTKATPSPEGTIEVTPSPNSDIGSPSSESQAGDAVDSHIYSTSLSTQKQPTYSTKRRTPAFNRESLTVEQVIGISGGTFLFLILLTYAAECVDGQIAARKRKELKLRKAESKENKT